jgi:hypothetical protein
MGSNLWSMGQQALEKCPSCGAQTRPGEHFCVNCGHRLLAAIPSSQQAQPDMGDVTSPNSPGRWSARKGVRAIGPKLLTIGCICLALLAGCGLLGLLGLLIQIGGPWTGGLILLAGVIGYAIVHYQKGTLLPFLIVVVLLPLLGILGIDKKIGIWSVVLVLLLLGLSYLIAILFPHRLEQRLQQAMHYVVNLFPRRPRRASPSPYTPQERRLQQAMHYVGEHGVITCTVYCELTGVSEEVARHDLEELVKRGVLRATGNPQGGYYRFL